MNNPLKKQQVNYDNEIGMKENASLPDKRQQRK